MVWEEDFHDHSDEECRRRRYSSSSDSDLTTVLIAPERVIMEAEKQSQERTKEGEQVEAPAPPTTPTPTPTSETGSGEPEMNNKQCCRKTSQGLVGSAHIQLQLFVEDCKVELKELKLIQTGINRNKADKKADNNNEDENGNEKEVTDKGEKKEIKKVRTGWRRYIGIMLAVSSSMMFALAILIVKSLPQYHPFSVTLWRFQGVLLPAIPIMFYCRVIKKQMIFDRVFPFTAPGHPKTLFFIFLRGLSGASAVVLQFYSLQYISMADSSVIAFSTPVFVSLASHFLLGEKSGFIPIICGVITLGGVAIITRPPILTGGEGFDKETLIGTGLALACMFCAAATFLLLRYLRQIHFSVITGYFGLWGTIQSLALSASISNFQIPEGLNHWWMAGALALLTFVGQTFITLAFKYEEAGVVSLCRTCDILFAYLWQFVFLGEVPDLYSFIGGGIVIFGVVVAALRKYLSDLPEDNQTKKRLWILLT